MTRGLLIATIVLLVGGCAESESTRAYRQQELKANAQRHAIEAVQGIQYIKDAETGLCFAYYWGGMASGGPALTVVPCEVIPAEKLIVANGPEVAGEKDASLATVASAAQVAEVDTTNVMANLGQMVSTSMVHFDSLLALDGARPFPKDQDYIERATYERCADILLTTTRVFERATFRSPESQRAVAALAMREWRSRFMAFRHFRTGFGMSGMNEGRDWMALCQMGYQYIAVLEPAFEEANSLATHITAGSE